MIIIQYRERADKRANKGAFNEHGGQKDDFTETLQKLYRNLTEIDRKIVELIVSDKFVTTTKIAEQIGESRQTIATRIKKLIYSAGNLQRYIRT